MIASSLRPLWNAALLACALACLPAAAHAQPAAADTAALRLPSPAVRRWQVGVLRADRLRHASLSLTLGLGAGLMSRSPMAAALTGLGIGLAKELYDIHRTGFDPVDLGADAIGTGMATFATVRVDR